MMLKVKLTEVQAQLSNICNDSIVRESHLVSLLRSYDLITELKDVVK